MTPLERFLRLEARHERSEQSYRKARRRLLESIKWIPVSEPPASFRPFKGSVPRTEVVYVRRGDEVFPAWRESVYDLNCDDRWTVVWLSGPRRTIVEYVTHWAPMPKAAR